MAAPARASACGMTHYSMLADDDAPEAMVWGDDGIISGLPPRGIYIAMDTHSFALTEIDRCPAMLARMTGVAITHLCRDPA